MKSDLAVIVTGTSSGIGKAIAELHLSEGSKVTGVGRRHTITHENYQAVTCDLFDAEAVAGLTFSITGPCLLINNAGTLGNVRRMSEQQTPDLQEVLAVNVVAPGILMSKLAAACGDRFPLTVVNISSGAAKRAIPSWAAYCASKAALEILSETFLLEEREKGRMTKVYCVAPGVVDTPMQEKIRSASPEHFSASAGFHAYKENHELDLPEMTAKKLQILLDIPYNGTVSHSLRTRS